MDFRSHQDRSLNLEVLLYMLRRLDVSHNPKGKKRAGSPGIDGDHPTKRFRPRTYVNDTSHLVAETTEDVVDSDEEDTRQVPIYRHVLEFTYTTSPLSEGSPSITYVDDDEAKQRGWLQQEQELDRWLKSHGSSSAPNNLDSAVVTFELGEHLIACEAPMPYAHVSTHLCLFANPAAEAAVSAGTLLTLPNVDPHFDSEAHDLRTPNISDPLLACFWLAESHPKRAALSARLQLIVDPHITEANTAIPILPFRLRVEIDVSFILPTIFEPPWSPKGQRDLAEVQRRVLLHIFPYGVPPEAFHGQVDIPLLYSILGPAPPLSSPALEEALQPEDLVPTLLPFQRRSVGWMLAREGKTVDPSGELVAKSSSSSAQTPLFWKEVRCESASDAWYVDRLRGEIMSKMPDEGDAKGGILAEEPGLGKTLECIALILLNPAIGRTPSNKRWDAEAKVYVKQVKVCFWRR